MYYVIGNELLSNVPLIPQTESKACWYASARMVIQWRRNNCGMIFVDEPDPSEILWSILEQQANNGLALEDITYFASLMGFQIIPPITPTLNTVKNWLISYGPIFTIGLKKISYNKSYGHAVVIAGVSDDNILIYDPEPINQGSIVWEPASWLTTTLSLATRIIPTNFMHYPSISCP